MDSWEQVPLNKLFRLTNGKSVAGNYTDYKSEENPYPVYGGNGILGYTNSFLLSDPTVIIGRVGEYCGNVTLSENKIWVSDNALYISEYLKDIDQLFLIYLLTYVDLNKYNDATGQPKITQSLFKRIKPRIPASLIEQKAIAAILSRVDEAIEANNKGMKAAEQLKKSLMQNLLTGKIRPDGTWRSSEEFYMDDKFGKVPKGWEVTSIGLITDSKTKSFDPQKSKTVKKYIGLEHIEPGTFTRIGMGSSDETLSLKSEFSPGDVLLGKLRPYLNKVWFADIEGVCSTEFLVFPKGRLSTWMYLNFQSKRFLDYTTSMTAGTQHPRISWRDVKRYKVSFPTNEEERRQIEETFIALKKGKENQLSKINSLKALKESLMQNLLTGKVRVNVEKIDKLLTEV